MGDCAGYAVYKPRPGWVVLPEIRCCRFWYLHLPKRQPERGTHSLLRHPDAAPECLPRAGAGTGLDCQEARGSVGAMRCCRRDWGGGCTAASVH